MRLPTSLKKFIVAVFFLIPFFVQAQPQSGIAKMLDGTEVNLYGPVTLTSISIIFNDAKHRTKGLMTKKIKAMQIGVRYFDRIPKDKKGKKFGLMEIKLSSPKLRMFAEETGNDYALYFLDENNQLMDIKPIKLLKPYQPHFREITQQVLDSIAGYFPGCPGLKDIFERKFKDNEDALEGLDFNMCGGGLDPHSFFQ